MCFATAVQSLRKGFKECSLMELTDFHPVSAIFWLWSHLRVGLESGPHLSHGNWNLSDQLLFSHRMVI